MTILPYVRKSCWCRFPKYIQSLATSNQLSYCHPGPNHHPVTSHSAWPTPAFPLIPNVLLDKSLITLCFKQVIYFCSFSNPYPMNLNSFETETVSFFSQFFLAFHAHWESPNPQLRPSGLQSPFSAFTMEWQTFPSSSFLKLPQAPFLYSWSVSKP